MLQVAIAAFLFWIVPPAFGISAVFEPNVGQADGRFRYLGRTGASPGRIFVEDGGLRLDGGGGERAIRLVWGPGVKGGGSWAAEDPTGTITHYCNSGPLACDTGVPAFRRLIRRELYPHVDWVVYGHNAGLEYDLVVHPGADIAGVRLRVEGAAAGLDGQGRLQSGKVVQWRPVAYQWVEGQREPVAVEWRDLGDGEFGFAVEDYRADLDLVIDPVVSLGWVSGGEGEDAVRGTVVVRSQGIYTSTYRYGTTRSRDWTLEGVERDTDVFVEFNQSGAVTRTIWGGAGDEEIGGADVDANNARLYIVGWTSSAEVPPGPNRWRPTRSRSGSGMEGFLLEVGFGHFAWASFVGGPGEDRVHDIRLMNQSFVDPIFALVGETTDANWSDATVTQVGPGGGGSDAFVAILRNWHLSLLAFGGNGADRAMRLRALNADWVVGGESTSSDFPVSQGEAGAAGRDVFLGLLGPGLEKLEWLRLFGGTGDEGLGGIANDSAEGLVYVAGTTNSAKLPGSVETSFGGGGSDGFLALVDAEDGTPRRSMFVGGSGLDEVRSVEARGGLVILGGTTDSQDLALPGLERGTRVLGGLDALVVIADGGTGEPLQGFRLGGSGDDRAYHAGAEGLGVVTVSGGTDSAEWIRELDSGAEWAGGMDAFSMRLSYAAYEVQPFAAPALTVGKNLQLEVALKVVSETTQDGMLRVRSLDPSRLVVSKSASLAGTGEILLSTAKWQGGAGGFVMQALGDDGEVEVVIEGRAGSPDGAFYPRRRLRVQLAPAGLFWTNVTNSAVRLPSTEPLGFQTAPVLPPDGRPGSAQAFRPGYTAKFAFRSSDPAGLPEPGGDSVQSSGSRGIYSVAVTPLREGEYSLTPLFADGTGQPGAARAVRALRVDTPDPRLVRFSRSVVYLPEHHVVQIPLAGREPVRVISEDPEKLRLGLTTGSASEASVTVTGTVGVYAAGYANRGSVRVRVEGTSEGRAVQEIVEFRFVPTAVEIEIPSREIPVGGSSVAQIRVRPQYPLVSAPEVERALALVDPRKFGNLRMDSSNPGVVASRSLFGEALTFAVDALQPGTATLRFAVGPSDEPFHGPVMTVTVTPATIDFGMEELLIPASTSLDLFPAIGPTFRRIQNVRVRLSEGAPFELLGTRGRGKDIVTDFVDRAVRLIPENTQPGQVATLFVSAAGIPEKALPIRVLEPVMLPVTPEIRILPNTTGVDLSFRVGGMSGERPVWADRLQMQVERRVRLTATPPGVCEVPETVLLQPGLLPSVRIQCMNKGVTTVWLEPDAGLSAAQPRFPVRIISGSYGEEPLLALPPVFTGKGLQVEVFPRSLSQRPFTGTITSLDPARVRLSTGGGAEGTEKVTVSAENPLRSLFVQGYGSEGTVVLVVESTDGRRQEIPVYLFGSTLAVRAGTTITIAAGDLSGETSVEHPTTTETMVTHVAPYLVDPASGRLVHVDNLTIRGGTDPFFVRGESSEPGVLLPVPPDALLSEGERPGQLNFRVIAVGQTVLRVTQPEGFIAVPESELRVRVFERELTFVKRGQLGADLQFPTEIIPFAGTGGRSPVTVPVTVRSLDAGKLLVSTNTALVGQESVVVPPNGTVVLQGMSGVAPGERVKVRLEAPGFATSEREIRFLRAAIQPLQPPPKYLAFSPVQQLMEFVLGPVEEQGRGEVARDSTFSLRPGAVGGALQVRSLTPNVVEVVTPSVPLNGTMQVWLRGRAIGQGFLEVTAPAGWAVQTQRILVEVR